MTVRCDRSLAEVVLDHVSPGDSVYLGNFGAQLFAVGHELIRQKLRGLHIIIGSGGLLLDQLIGAGVVDTATFGHCWSPIGPEPTWNFRRAAEAGTQPHLRELSLGMLGAALQAAAWQVPFLPVTASPETGYATSGWDHGLLGVAKSPFGASLVVAALQPDVAFIHADAVDRLGNAVIRSPLGESLIAAAAAATTIVVAEELINDSDRYEELPALAGALVSESVIVPGAVQPDGTINGYARSVADYQAYSATTKSESGFRLWLEQAGLST